MFIKRLGLILFLLLQAVLGQTYIVPDLQRDDFTGTSLNSWWKINISPSSGSQHQLTINNGYLKADLVDPLDGQPGGRLVGSDGMENIGFASTTYQIYDKSMVLEAKIRIKTLNSLPVGSRGWGTWRSEKLPITINQSVWFIEQTAYHDSSWAADETWWRARTVNGVNDQNDKYTNLSTIDNTQWHTYRVVRYSGGTSTGYYEHYVDGTLIQRITPSDFTPASIITRDYEFHCWNDNLVYHFIDRTPQSLPDTIEVFYNGWLGTSSFIVDFVEIRKDGYDPSYSVSPVDASDFLRLRNYESEIDDGVSDGLWKTYSFDTNTGNTFVIITAKAETYDGYDGDDDLKVVVDATDYGYDNLNSWNGDVDDGLPKTLVFTPLLAAGNHTIKLYSQTTPILYDVNVLNSFEGSLVLDQTLNETAPSGSDNYLWKQFSFNCDAGPIAIYVSASADHEPGWDHKNANIDSTDDDELRIELDNTDFGWGSDKGFVGNALHGDVKTVLIKDTVAGGGHTLKLYANETPTVYRVLVFAENGDYSLPVTLASFTARSEKNRVNLSWKTESEVNTLGFNLFRAEGEDSILPVNSEFKKINKSLISAAGSSPASHEYFYTDTLTTQEAYLWYRLYLVNLDGTVELLKTTTVQNPSTKTVTDLKLLTNYPNPFNPNTTIKFFLARPQQVTVEIFNLNGKKIRTLLRGKLAQGTQTLTWDARDAHGKLQSSGIYFYRIKAGKHQLTGKMTLLR